MIKKTIMSIAVALLLAVTSAQAEVEVVAENFALEGRRDHRDGGRREHEVNNLS